MVDAQIRRETYRYCWLKHISCEYSQPRTEYVWKLLCFCGDLAVRRLIYAHSNAEIDALPGDLNIELMQKLPPS